MIGLPKNINLKIIDQWRQLFYEKKTHCSFQAHRNWEAIENLELLSSFNKDLRHVLINSLSNYRLINSYYNKISHVQCNKLSLNLDTYRLVFFNGVFISEFSDSNDDLWQIKVQQGLNCQILPDPIKSDFFLNLIESLSSEITIIYLNANKIIKKPLYLLHISQGSNDNKLLTNFYYRHHLVLEANTHGQVIEHFVSLNDNRHFHGARTSIILSSNSRLDYIKLLFENHDSYHVSRDDVHLGENSYINSNTFILGNKFNDCQICTKTNNIKANALINSLSVLSNKNINHISTYLEHNNSYCYSHQLHKMIIRHDGKGIFHGLIKVKKNALKTDGQMINKNLLLDSLSEIYTKPQLEIYADDVKCSHSATVSNIDYKQIFYLCSRGILFEDAKQMIIYAFAVETVDNINNKELRYIILSRIINILQKKYE